MSLLDLRKLFGSIASRTTSVLGTLGLSAIAFVSIVNFEPVYGASLSFKPVGNQLDSDSISDIATTPGSTISFETLFNPTGISGTVVVFYNVQYDPQELELIGRPEPLSSEFGSVKFSNGRINVGNIYEPIADDRNPISSFLFKFKVLPGLKNDGTADFAFVANSASGYYEISGQQLNSTNLQQPTQMVEVQPKPVPEPLTILGSGVALGFGGILRKRYFKKLKQKAIS